jgi:hypothetical protein
MKYNSRIIKTHGKGFLEEKQGIKVLHLKGAPYERGYQHGVLLKDEILEVLTSGLTGAAAVITKATGNDFSLTIKKMMVGAKTMERYIPLELKEEIRGIADGIADAGISLTYDDVLLWNTMYDQWCFYAHPNYADPNNPPIRCSYPPGCSSFSAWGRATLDGKMIFGKNMDNLNLPGIIENRILVIVDPEHGYGHAFITHPGMLAIDGGINEDGIAMMTHYSASVNEGLQGCGIGVLTRLILSKVHRIEDAIELLTVYPKCTGINYHVADSKVNRAVVIEVSATEVEARYPEQDKDILWTTNHFNCYPEWKGYTGYNMVLGQAPVYGLADVTTIERWQNSLIDRKNNIIPAAGRFKRYEQLLKENYGKITIENGIKMLSDRYDPYTGEERSWTEPSPGHNDIPTISMLYHPFPNDKIIEGVNYYKTNKTGSVNAYESNLWSLISVLRDGDIWLAIKDFPAQRGPYEFFNLIDELNNNI